jgi:hypothetical protein
MSRWGWIIAIRNAMARCRRGVCRSEVGSDGDGPAAQKPIFASIRATSAATTANQQLRRVQQIYSNGLDQDTDHDSLDDSSIRILPHPPLLPELDSTRSAAPRISCTSPRFDLPRPEITVSESASASTFASGADARERRDLGRSRYRRH